jgi:subtilisin family serine protease
MKRTLFAALFLALPIAAFAADSGSQRMIVVTRDSAQQLMAKASDIDFVFDGTHDVKAWRVINGFVANLTDAEIAKLKRSPNVQFVEEIIERHALEVDKNDAATDTVHAQADALTPGGQTTAYGVQLVNAPAVWPYTKGKSLDANKPIRVAIIDTGIDYNASELKSKYKGGFNFINGTSLPFDDAGHGTHVAGIIAAADDNSGTVGVAPEVELWSLKALNECGSGSNAGIVDAIDWITKKKAEIGGNWIVNMSLGSSTPSEAEELAIERAVGAGVLFIAASGNSYDEEKTPSALAYPAAYSTTVSVGAVDANSAVGSFSQRGPDLKVVAPGVSVLSTFADGGITFPDGTKSVARYANAFDSKGKEFCFGHPSMSGDFVFVKTGLPSDYPSNMTGKIALIERGGTDPGAADPSSFTFLAKAKYAKAAGAAGAVVYSIPGREFVQPGMTFGTGVTQTAAQASVVPLVLISEADGAKLKAMSGKITVGLNSNQYSSTFDLLDGTSMASPHAAGVAALIWAAAPNATASDIANAMELTAKDLGDKGRDNTYGFGLINALDAGKMLNPALFSSPIQQPLEPLPTSPTPSGRRATKRGR